MPKIIAFGYRKGSGKDTAAKFLDTFLRCEIPRLKVKHTGFAIALKDICNRLFNWAGVQPAVYYESHRTDKEIVLPKLGMSPRVIWISVGNCLRDIYQDVWVENLVHNTKGDIIIISDLRFRNEAQILRNNGAYLIKLNRNGLQIGNDPAEHSLDNWDDWDLTIDNNGSLQQLNEIVCKFGGEFLDQNWPQSSG